MKLKRSIFLVASVLLSASLIFGSCARKTCPAYGSIETESTEIQHG